MNDKLQELEQENEALRKLLIDAQKEAEKVKGRVDESEAEKAEADRLRKIMGLR